MKAMMPDSMLRAYVHRSVLEFRNDGTYSISGIEDMTQRGHYSILEGGKKLVFTFANRSDTTEVWSLAEGELVIRSRNDGYTMWVRAMP